MKTSKQTHSVMLRSVNRVNMDSQFVRENFSVSPHWLNASNSIVFNRQRRRLVKENMQITFTEFEMYLESTYPLKLATSMLLGFSCTMSSVAQTFCECGLQNIVQLLEKFSK